jgi:DnaJ homolog subfamily C member 28
MSNKNISVSDWETYADKQIRDAMEHGAFDNLPGAGKPLKLDEDPNVPIDWRLAFKILRDAGAAPEWIEQGKTIREELKSLQQFLERHSRWQNEQRAQLAELSLDAQDKLCRSLSSEFARMSEAFLQRATALNKSIDAYNLKVPDMTLQIPRLRTEEELQRIETTCMR